MNPMNHLTNYFKKKKESLPARPPQGKKKNKFKGVLAVILIIVAAAGFLKFISIKKQKALISKTVSSPQLEMSKEMNMPLVKVALVTKEDFQDVLPSMGTIRGYIEVDLKFEINGMIEKFNFKDGDKVGKGDIIAALDQRDVIVKYNYAELKLEEHEKLFEIGAITESKLKQVKLEEELAGIELEKTAIKAPFDGVINNREAETGRFVTINDRVATFSSINEVVAEVGIIEKDIEKIESGKKAVVRVDAYPNIEFEGLVSNVSSSFEGKSRTLTVRIKISNPKGLLMPGMFARVLIGIYEKKDALIVPFAALEKKEGEYSVFVVGEDNKARAKKVEVDYLSSEKAVINSGVDENERVVIDKNSKLQDGEEVKIIRD